MGPKVKILKAWEFGMRVFGVGRETSRLPETFVLLIRFLMVLGGIFYLMVEALVIPLDDKTFSQKLEAALLIMAGYPCCHKFFVLAARRTEIFKIVDRLNSLLGDIEDVYGPQTLVKYQKMTTFILVYYCSQFTCVVLPVNLYAYYVYYFEGDQDVLPYEMYIPFPPTTPGYVTWLCLYEFLTMLTAFVGMCFGNVFFGALTLAIILVLSKIRDHCEQLNSGNSEFMIKRIVHWHSEIILIVEEVNRLLGTCFVVEYMMGCAHISFSGYIILKAGVDANANVKKNIVCCLACIALPLFLASCGHIIKVQNEKLSRSIYENKWWEMKPKNRVDLLLPSMLANKGIHFHYRKLLTFDMTLYFKILKQSYSLLTILKMMDKS